MLCDDPNNIYWIGLKTKLVHTDQFSFKVYKLVLFKREPISCGVMIQDSHRRTNSNVPYLRDIVTNNIYVWNVIKSATTTYHTTNFLTIAQNLLAGYYQVASKFRSIVMKFVVIFKRSLLYFKQYRYYYDNSSYH